MPSRTAAHVVKLVAGSGTPAVFRRRRAVFLYSGAVWLCCGAGLTGCSFLAGQHSDSSPVGSQSESGAGVQSDKLVPFELQVIDELNDGKSLYVSGALKALTRWPRSDVVVVLTGFGNTGDVVHQTNLDAAAPAAPTGGLGSGGGGESDAFEPGETQAFALSMPADGLSNYRIEVFWGEDARLARSGSGKLKLIALEDVKVNGFEVPCETGPCPYRFTLTGVLHNNSDKQVDEVSLGMRIVWVPDKPGDGPVMPESEQLVTLPTNGLGPGETQPFKVRVGRDIPQRPGGFFKPALRVLGGGE